MDSEAVHQIEKEGHADQLFEESPPGRGPGNLEGAKQLFVDSKISLISRRESRETELLPLGNSMEMMAGILFPLSRSYAYFEFLIPTVPLCWSLVPAVMI
ncbi:hypothetical protein MRB53_003989 [Persea americana]|uniref:Uncharacterized protein n=1 Tax=Persea americana TaxID=3435 RepID=A0ACC2MYW9_PERAE|nr:hypothetical protein MRB53_003989 [Persea americana]